MTTKPTFGQSAVGARRRKSPAVTSGNLSLFDGQRMTLDDDTPRGKKRGRR